MNNLSEIKALLHKNISLVISQKGLNLAIPGKLYPAHVSLENWFVLETSYCGSINFHVSRVTSVYDNTVNLDDILGSK